MIKLISLLAVGAMVLFAAPAFASEDVATGKMSFVEFSNAPQNHGLGWKVIRKNYDLYLIGHAPQATLNKSRLRSDEIRKRS